MTITFLDRQSYSRDILSGGFLDSAISKKQFQSGIAVLVAVKQHSDLAAQLQPRYVHAAELTGPELGGYRGAGHATKARACKDRPLNGFDPGKLQGDMIQAELAPRSRVQKRFVYLLPFHGAPTQLQPDSRAWLSGRPTDDPAGPPPPAGLPARGTRATPSLRRFLRSIQRRSQNAAAIQPPVRYSRSTRGTDTQGESG